MQVFPEKVHKGHVTLLTYVYCSMAKIKSSWNALGDHEWTAIVI